MEGFWPELVAVFDACAAFAIARAQLLWVYLTTTWTTPNAALYWVYIVAFFFWARLAFVRNYQGRGFANFLRFCFPKELYRHPSTATDVQVLLVNRFFQIPNWLLAGFGAPYLAALLLGLDWGERIPQFPLGPATSLIFWAVWLAAAEFGYYIAHRACHQIPILWEFHKVHHSAEVLTPLTLWRKHPVFDSSIALCIAVIRGGLLAAVALAFGGEFHAVHLFELNLYLMIYRLAGQHLRHSHIWWAWGPRISHVFLSPAQHQVHHSCAERHIDKNFGEIFAIWDWLFGSLYVAGEKEPLEIGIGDPNHQITNAFAAYFVPFRNAARIVVARWRPQP